VAICWLISHLKLTPEEAQRKLSELRPQVDRDLATRPEVVEFCASLKERKE